METPLFKHFGVDEKVFWNEVNHLPELYRRQGITHIAKDTLYLNHILTYIQKGIFKNLNNALLRKLGKQLVFHKGLPGFLRTLQEYVAKNPLYQKHNIVLEHYIVSTGLKEMILGSEVAKYVEGVWANEFIEDIPQPGFLQKEKIKKTKELQQVAYVLDNTSKTRALFEVNKGINKLSQLDVNSLLPDEARRVPFTQMVFIADGPSDIPCFAIVNKYGGKTVAVYKPGSQINFIQAHELYKQKRVQLFGEATYTQGSYLSLGLTNMVDEIATKIIYGKEAETAKPIRHILNGEYVYDEKIDK